ncbi:MAG: hypothetical protein SFW07_06355 [Gammaproteobacteria bacterium]|nr:hypothetical protein [Gammaproteobacteria bacterium]
MKKLIFTLSFFCLSLFSLNAFALKTTDIFVQTAPEATITKSAEPHTYQLTLKNIANYATYFSDRPSRTSNVMTLQSFLESWNKGFLKDAPNASISGVVNDKLVNFPAELTQPSYDAAKKTLTYIVHPLEGKESTIPHNLRMSDVSLFIDPLCLSCLG